MAWGIPRGLLRHSHRAKAFDRLARTAFVELDEGADLALALGAKPPRGGNLDKALGPLDCLGLRRELKDRVAADQLLCFGERPVDYHAFAAGVSDPRALRAWLEALARDVYAGLYSFLHERSHRGQGFLVREDAGLRVLVGPDDAHVTHRSGSAGRRRRS